MFKKYNLYQLYDVRNSHLFCQATSACEQSVSRFFQTSLFMTLFSSALKKCFIYVTKDQVSPEPTNWCLLFNKFPGVRSAVSPQGQSSVILLYIYICALL